MAASHTTSADTHPPFHAPYAEDDEAIARRLFARAASSGLDRGKIDRQARHLVEAIRRGGASMMGIEQVMQEYSLSSKEGLALMVLAEALLRVPDADTADDLIEDKLALTDFEEHQAKSDSPLIRASTIALGIAARLLSPAETPEGILARVAKRLGMPAVRAAAKQAVRIMGDHFVLSETIQGALRRARSDDGRAYRYSFDMLGEGARTAADAAGYAESYAEAIEAIGHGAGSGDLPQRPGISVKLSALHPRYDALSRGRILRELVPTVIELARSAKTYDLNFTLDAEEASRLELSLDVAARVYADPGLAGWDGFGLAVQAYQKRAPQVIEWLGELAASCNGRMMIRLVKGAYWDTEIKRAQERGLDDYPVFTRKAMTDLTYLACAEQLLKQQPRLFAQFATHNALTVTTVIELAGKTRDFEFQRLHGMGQALYDALLETDPALACRVYAPVGNHRDLLAYLVRRLLENGANSSFVSAASDPSVPVETLLRHPADILGLPDRARHRRIPRPADLFGAERRNSSGVELGHAASVAALLAEIGTAGEQSYRALPIIGGEAVDSPLRPVISPIDGSTVAGAVGEASDTQADAAMNAAARGFPAWNATPAATRAACLERAAERIEESRGRLLHLLQVEGGKTLDDSIAEVREAVDYCQYYAAQGRAAFVETPLPGPTGEANLLRLRGRGVFVAIAPWNFPLAIFLGQTTAALMAGNSVVAKPAEQTPLVAAEAIRLLHKAGIPTHALHLVPGDGRVGARLVAHRQTAGVVFTGSTAVAQSINRALAARNGPILPFIAETGGINAMIVDSTALPEQVADDVVSSAFQSAGQRCSALRLLFVQEDVAGRIVEMIVGAAKELKVGDPRDPSVQVGPVIDAEARSKLLDHVAVMRRSAKVLFAGEAPEQGLFVAPHVIELPEAGALTEEIFGPILHIVRYRAKDLDDVLDAIAVTGYGLTLGVQSRLDQTARRIAAKLTAGNVYVNRNMIGAVVGVQPFGGNGLSGTGPKAGGPHYLPRFAMEQAVTVNTAAAGGNASLVTMTDVP